LCHGRLASAAAESASTIQRFIDEGERCTQRELAVPAIIHGLGVSGPKAQALVRNKLTSIAVPANSMLEREHARMQMQATSG